MRNSETGEYELVMGNRQLLSGFFIVALLFGVAFAMGYIVGRNSTPTPKGQPEASAPSPVIEQRPAAVGHMTPPAGEAPKTEAQPPVQPNPEPAKAEVPAATPAASTPPPAAESNGEPPAGNYWQVIAAKQAEAESVRKALREKGFPAHLVAGPNSLIRVIVGPYPDREALGKVKADLENSGFNPHLLKR